MDVAAELTFLGVERRDLPTLVRRQELSNDSAAEATQFVGEILPVVCGDARLRGLHRGGRGCDCQAGLHTVASLSIRDRFSSTPQRWPEIVPLLRMTRWHGMPRAIAFAAQALATARAPFGSPTRRASAA